LARDAIVLTGDDLGQRDSFYVVDAAEDYYDSWVKPDYLVVES